MKVNYFFRAQHKAYSIEKVFHTLITALPAQVSSNSYFVPGRDASLLTLYKNILFTYKHRNKEAVHHVTGDIHYCIIGLIGCKSVLTIHDLVFLKNAKNPVDRFLKWLLWVYIPVKLASRVVCISENTKRELLQQVKSNRVEVIHNPVAANFKKSLKPFAAVPSILHIGTGWNKNLDRVMEAVANLGYNLRIVGKISDSQAQIAKKYNLNYSVVSHLSDIEIAEEYANCDIVSFPSIYEGFGMPIIEAQASGKPILTSYLAPMTEIGGNSVHYVDPLDVAAIKNGFQEITENKIYREDLVNKGFKNVMQFSAVSISNQYVQIYNSLVR